MRLNNEMNNHESLNNDRNHHNSQRNNHESLINHNNHHNHESRNRQMIELLNNQMKKMFPLSTSRPCPDDRLTANKKSTP